MIRMILPLLFIAPSLAWAAVAWQPLDPITTGVSQFIGEYYAARYPEYEIDVQVNAPDSRLKLRLCDKILTYSANNMPANGGNLSTQVQCDGSQPWSIYISSQVDIWADIIVAQAPIARGSLLSEEDLQFQRANLAQTRKGTLLRFQDAVGLQAVRTLKTQQAIRIQDLVEPLAVHKGDNVQVAANIGGLRVITPGTALSHGRIGEQISVTNNQSNRRIRAKIVAEGMVEVAL